jgi:DNA-binding transcriptional MerR regulator
MGEQKSNKLYYSIGEVSEKFKVNASLIRFWEKEFDILKPKKNKKGNRLFTPKDLENLELIYQLVKERGFTLEGAKKKIRDNKSETLQEAEMMRSLKKVRSFLIELKEAL